MSREDHDDLKSLDLGTPVVAEQAPAATHAALAKALSLSLRLYKSAEQHVTICGQEVPLEDGWVIPDALMQELANLLIQHNLLTLGEEDNAGDVDG